MGEGTWTPELLDALMSETGVAMDRGVRARHLAGTDWGEVVTGSPWAVARPAGAEQAAAIVAFAASRGLRLTLRGTGATEGGQAVADDSVILDTLGLDDVSVESDRGTVVCGPGATWRSVLHATLPLGVVPPVVPLGLDVTVGGVLATGGFGSTSHLAGGCVSHVEELDVAVGSGQVVRCSRSSQPDLFDAVLGGLGRVGLITRAVLRLQAVGATAFAAKVHYDDVGTWLADLDRVRREPQLNHVETFAPRAAHGHGFDMTIGTDRPGAALSDVEKVVAGLNCARVDDVYEAPVMRFYGRLDPRLENLIAGGRAGQLHPWVESFLPVDVLGRIVGDMLDQAAGDENDKMHIVLVDTAQLPPLVAVPSTPLVACAVVAPVGIPRDQLDWALERMRGLHELVVGSGGTRYYTGWIPSPDAESWKAHLGAAHDGWAAAKAAYDPAGTFTAALWRT